MHCNPYIIVNKCHISRSQHDPKRNEEVHREGNSSPPRKHPIIFNDMIDRNAKTPSSSSSSSSSVKRIYKLGHKYRSKSCEIRTEIQHKSCETPSVINTHEIEERSSSRPSSAKHFITRRRNCVSPSCTTSTAAQNFSQTHVDNVEKKDLKCKNPNDAELKNGDREFTNETCTTKLYGQTDTCRNKSGIYTNRQDRRRRNCVSPADTNRANSRERKCTTPQSTTNQNSQVNSYAPNKTERICRRSSPARYADQKRNCKSPCVSPVNVDRKKSSPVKCQDQQEHHTRSQFPLSNVNRHCVSPIVAEHNEKSRQGCRSSPHINCLDHPIRDCWSPVCNKNEYCNAQSCNNPHCSNYSTDSLASNCVSPYKDNLERDNGNQYCTDNHNKQATRNGSSHECQGTLLDQNHNFDYHARVCGSNSSPIQRDNSVQQLTNTANYSTSTSWCPSSKDINNADQMLKTSSCARYHHDQSLNNQKSTTSYDSNEIKTNGRSSPATINNNVEQKQRCQSQIDNRNIFDKHCNSSASTNNNANVQNQTSRKSSCDESCDIIGRDDRNSSRGNKYNDTDRTCQNATGGSNGEKIESYCRSPHNFNNNVKQEPSNEDQHVRGQSCIPHYDTSDLNSKTAIENPDCDREMNAKSPTSDKQLKSLGKKCRSVSSSNQERRRWGTPLTLILYVKKKCQSKIRKIMASKNHVAASKTLDSEVLDNDGSVNQNNVLPEVDKTSQETQNGDGCDANGNNIYRNTVRKNSKPEENKDIPDTGDPKQTEIRNKQLTEEEMVRLESFSRLDPSTLHVIGWSSGATDSMSSTQNLTETQEDENMCKLSRVEFKRLQDQVRDVSFNLRNRFRTSAYQKLYQQPHPTPLENATQLYRTQLAASLRAFKPKDWPPLNTQELETSYLRCKPINCQNDSNSSQSTRCCSAKVRPKSVPPSAFRNRTQQKRSETPTDVRPGNFDSLNPRVLSHLLSDNISPTSYGEIPKNLIKPERNDSPQKPKDDDVSTSGIESTPTDDTSSSDDEDDSDYEPEVDENRLAPDLYLRPEKLDSLVLPDSAKGWRKFDFDADNVHFPIYAFANPLPDPFEDLDLRQIARLKWNWRDQTRHRTREKGVDDLLDRMVELERLQIETEDWEQKRTAQINKRVSKRAMSAKYPRDKRCCSKCLQPACTGDCPEKNVQSEVCELCRQPFCIKTCSDTKYDQRMRQSRSDDKMTVQRSANPKYCRSCQTKHNAKFINANNIVLGRPKSCNTTYSRGQASNKPKDYRPRSDTPVSIDLFQEFDKLGIDAQQPVRPTTAKIQRPRSRNSSFPSKSFYSQRRDSLTEADKNRFKKKVQKNSKVLVRRPKTAV